jgi:hypothetical protein
LTGYRRARAVYFGALCSAAFLFFCAGQISPGMDAVGWSLGLVRFLLVAAAIGSAILTWATAVHLAYVYRVTWPVGLATALVVGVVGTTAIRWFAGR